MVTTSIDKMARTAQEVAEAQRDSYEALMESFTASQRRGIRVSKDGLKFFELQEENARAAQEWFANGVRLLQLQQRNVSFAQDWLDGGAEAVREQAEHNVRVADALARSTRLQREGLQTFGRAWIGAYQDFFSPFARESVKTARQATQQGLEATRQVARQNLRVAEEAAEQTEAVLRRTEEATREAELQAIVHGALKVGNYDELTVDEVAKRLDGITVAELRKVREYEKQNKGRETLVEQIDRKIKAAS